MRFEDPYEILGLKPEASLEEVKAACEKLQQQEDRKEEAQAACDQILASAEEKQQEAPAEEPAEAPAEEKTEPAAAQTQQEEPAQEKKEEKKKATPGQIALGVVSIVILVAVLVALILAAMDKPRLPSETQSTVPVETAPLTEPAPTTEPTIPADGNPDDETAKGTYTGTDEAVRAAAANVVATMGEHQLTNSQFQIYYWMGVQRMLQSNPYIQYMGLDLSRGFDSLDSQVCPILEGRTWQQYFVSTALSDWHVNQSMVAQAEQAGYVLPADRMEMLTGLAAQMEEEAKANGFDNALSLLQNTVGAGAEVADYLQFAEDLELGQSYYSEQVKKQTPTDEQLESYYTENTEELNASGISKDNRAASVRHILISPENTEEEASWTQAQEKAKEILDQFLAGDRTEESFGALAAEHTMDPGSQQTGGLYEDFGQGQMVPEFDQWSFDTARKNGDTDIVKTDFGYHIMYFVGSRPVWKEQVSQYYLQDLAGKFIEDSMESHPIQVDYSKILLGSLKAVG